MDPKFIMLWMDFFRETSMRVLMDSSSSSTSSMKLLVYMAMLTMMESCLLLREFKREWWRCPRANSFWTIIDQQGWSSHPRYRDMLYRRYFSMPFNLFQALFSEIEPYFSNSTQYVREPVPPKKAFCLVLHRLALATPTAVLKDLYGIGESTIRKYTFIVIDIIIQHLQGRFIAVPTDARLQKIMRDFQSLTLLPSICGSLGGTHIKLSYAPGAQHNPKGYKNRNRFYSVLLQGICDTDKVFWNVCVNAPGGWTEAEHWNSSDIKELVHRREILSSPSFEIGGRTIHPLLLADSAYPISSTILTPYKNNYSDLVVLFDEFLSYGYSKIESAFSILKCRWRMLQNVAVRLENVPKLVVACCVLHNFLQMSGESEPEESLNSQPYSTLPDYPDFTDRQNGELQRNILFEEWLQQYLLTRVNPC